jgi:hypothetical protein
MRTSRINTAAVLLLLSWGVSVQSYIFRDPHHKAIARSGSDKEAWARMIPKEQEHTRRVELDSSSSSTDAFQFQDRIGYIGAVAALSVSSTDPATATLNPLEAWCLSNLDRCYRESQSIKCPFLRRRYGDILDNVETLMKHTLVRRQCWPLLGPPQAWRPAGSNKKQQCIKYKGLSLEELRSFVWNDWRPETGKGYYITGKLSTACYRDDCFFLGPDPDMPIRGLRKYVGVAAHLFDFHESCATLKSLEVVDDTLVAEWQLKGILRLPWKPHLPTFSGKTVYQVDADGLIERHEEFWNISVAHAFCFTLFPKIAQRIWKDSEEEVKPKEESGTAVPI